MSPIAAGPRWLTALGLALLAAGCGPRAPASAPTAGVTDAGELRAMLEVLAADSLEGRRSGTRGAAKAAAFIAATLARAAVRPGGDSGYFQRVPLPQGADVNVVGLVLGADRKLREQAVIVGAHFDHLGIGSARAGDSIYNGADDDASGVVTVLAVARAIAAGPPPKRTVVFLLTTGEEIGLVGTRWYIRHPVVPLERTVADLQIEMVGRPDSLVGGAGTAWLTGYEHSTLGAALAAAGIAVMPDPRPAQRFFERSDNIAFARLGIPAHTLSSYGMHADYHTPADEASRVDIDHLVRVVASATRAVRLLADGPAPEWRSGGRPAVRGER